MNTYRDSQGIRVGVAGWSYDDWKGIVYPPHAPKSFHPLHLLGELFDTVELNVTFYRPVAARMAAGWVSRAAPFPEFRFTAKLWQRFTHERGEAWTEADVRAVTDGLAPLVESQRLGALLVQFPWSFKRTPENRQWLARVLDTFAAYPLALEIRHASWNIPEVFEQLAQRGVGFCNIDQPMFRHSLGATNVATAPLGYVRLHGRNVHDWFREDASRDERYDYLYSEDELAPWIETTRELSSHAASVYVVTNNHFRGQAVVNALEMKAALGGRIPKLPEHLLAAYPRLKRLAVD